MSFARVPWLAAAAIGQVSPAFAELVAKSIANPTTEV